MEGQYMSGIAVLDQLRSPHLAPSVSHIRQLLYIALYPPPMPVNDKGKEKENVKGRWEPVTPSKHVKQAQRSPLIPTEQASEAAIRLLKSFVLTNSPGVLAKALPECVGISEWNERLRQLSEMEAEDSFIAGEATCITEARNFWEILKEGKIQRKIPLPFSPAAKGKKKKQVVAFADEPSFGNGDDDMEAPVVVGDNAWPVLDWFLLLVEKDEDIMEQCGFPRHSPILLAQIPPPRTNSGARWEADALLDVVFYALEQSDDIKRKAAGARLWTALVNLAATTHMNLELLVASVHSRLSSLSRDPALVLSALPPSERAARFKIALCREYLVSSTAPTNGAVGPRPAIRPKPQARAMRAARRSNIEGDRVAPSEESTTVVETPASPTQLVNAHPLPNAEELLKLLSEGTDNSQEQLLKMKVKFYLLSAYASIQAKSPTEEWTQIVRDGKVNQAIDLAFKAEGGVTYATLARAVIQ
ncbi:hypothetical protein HWV62_37484 [Athelia sp. TMB]|nr:hypothetical protein HWV62_37484 [Athelia sp. TMB]